MWLQADCSAAPSVSDAVAAGDVILLMLADAAAIHDALLSDESRRGLAGKTVLQMGTIGPDESREIAAIVKEAGGEYIEAPVLGSQPEAEKGTLLVMVGCAGDMTQTRAWPVLKALSSDPRRIGEVRCAARLNLASAAQARARARASPQLCAH